MKAITFEGFVIPKITRVSEIMDLFVEGKDNSWLQERYEFWVWTGEITFPLRDNDKTILNLKRNDIIEDVERWWNVDANKGEK